MSFHFIYSHVGFNEHVDELADEANGLPGQDKVPIRYDDFMTAASEVNGKNRSSSLTESRSLYVSSRSRRATVSPSHDPCKSFGRSFVLDAVSPSGTTRGGLESGKPTTADGA